MNLKEAYLYYLVASIGAACDLIPTLLPDDDLFSNYIRARGIMHGKEHILDGPEKFEAMFKAIKPKIEAIVEAKESKE